MFSGRADDQFSLSRLIGRRYDVQSCEQMTDTVISSKLNADKWIKRCTFPVDKGDCDRQNYDADFVHKISILILQYYLCNHSTYLPIFDSILVYFRLSVIIRPRESNIRLIESSIYFDTKFIGACFWNNQELECLCFYRFQ